MSDVKLYLDGELVDVDSKTAIVETKQINSLFDLKDRQTSFTRNFTLLLTKETSNILDKIGHKQSVSEKPYRNLKPQLYRNGTPTITGGKFVVKSVIDSNKVKGNIQDGVVSLFDDMGSKTLSDLDFTDANHIFSKTKLIQSYTHEWEDIYVYPLLNCGVFESESIDHRYQSPAIYMKWLFEQIFKESNYTYTYRGANNPLESEYFKTKAITIDKGILTDVNNVVDFSLCIRSIKQKDFFKAVLQMFGLMFQKEKSTNNYEFITTKDLFTDRLGAQDLSNKLFEHRNTSFKLGNYGKVNSFKYKYDQENADFADGSFDLDNETLKDSATMLTMPFKAPELSNDVVNNELIHDTPLFSVTRNDDGSIKDVKSKSSTPYIINISRRYGGLSFTDTPYTGIYSLANFEGLNFSSIIGANYSSFTSSINRAKSHTVDFELKASDVYAFDFLRLVYLAQFQRYFYCNKISNYKENKVTKVELIEINTSALIGNEYSDDYNNDYNN